MRGGAAGVGVGAEGVILGAAGVKLGAAGVILGDAGVTLRDAGVILGAPGQETGKVSPGFYTFLATLQFSVKPVYTSTLLVPESIAPWCWGRLSRFRYWLWRMLHDFSSKKFHGC